MVGLLRCQQRTDSSRIRTETVVEAWRFLHICAMAVNGFESCRVVDGKRVRRETYCRAVFGMQVQEVDMFVAAVGVVDVWERSQAGEERPGVGGERMEVEATDGQCEYGEGKEEQGGQGRALGQSSYSNGSKRLKFVIRHGETCIAIAELLQTAVHKNDALYEKR